MEIIRLLTCKPRNILLQLAGSSDRAFTELTRVSYFLTKLPAGDGADDDEGFPARRDRIGQWGIRRLVGQILLAGEETQERPALLRDLVADRPAQHRIASLERVEDRPQRDWAVDLKFYFA